MSEPVDVGCPHGHVWTEWWSLPDGTDHRVCGQCGWVQRRPDGGTWTDAVVIDRATAAVVAAACDKLADIADEAIHQARPRTDDDRTALWHLRRQANEHRDTAAAIRGALAGTEG